MNIIKKIFTVSILLYLTGCSAPSEPSGPKLPDISSTWQIAYISNGGSTYLNMTGSGDSVNIVYKPCYKDTTTSFHGYLHPIDQSEIWTGNIFHFKQVYFGRSDDGRLRYWLNGARDSMITICSSYGFYDYLLKRKQ
jgi:hypothetical protein